MQGGREGETALRAVRTGVKKKKGRRRAETQKFDILKTKTTSIES